MFTRFSLRDYNFKLLITVIIAMICGVVMINSADSSFTPKQTIGIGLGVIIMIFCLSIKLRLCVPVLPCVFHH